MLAAAGPQNLVVCGAVRMCPSQNVPQLQTQAQVIAHSQQAHDRSQEAHRLGECSKAGDGTSHRGAWVVRTERTEGLQALDNDH